MSSTTCKWMRLRGGSRNLGRGGGGGGGGGTGRGWVRKGDVPPPARSAEALSNIVLLTHIHNELSLNTKA